MRKTRPSVYLTAKGLECFSFSEFAEIIENEFSIRPEELWRELRTHELCNSKTLAYTTVGLIFFNAEMESPESIATTLSRIFIPQSVAEGFVARHFPRSGVLGY